MNNSQSGGYILPTGSAPVSGSLTLTQFIQTVLVGISGLPQTMVRPNWQPAPPKQPDLAVNWMAFGMVSGAPNANAYVWQDADGNTISQRHARLEIQCSFFGPEAIENADIVRDGFSIQQNLAALKAANMGYTEIGPANHVPDLVNERFINRVAMSIYLQREIQRLYPIVFLLSAKGSITGQNKGGENFNIDWQTQS